MKSLSILLGIGVLLAFCSSFPVQAAVSPSPKDSIRFNRDIRPILSDHCFSCHGPDDKHRKADLRLDTRTGLFSVHDDLTIVVPNHPEQSEIIRRITTKNSDDLMPPPEAKLPLTEPEISLIQTWINQGASWQDHWAFITPQSPPLPQVKNRRWVSNPIDYFILHELENASLSPFPEADQRTLIRRVSLDLTGLPPSPMEVEEFLRDASPNAYEKLVDRLLNSERFGERMALAWLDASRYGDSSVHHADGPRFMWPWRDWVINAYNQNLPFDQFTVLQLAGDLLPEPTIAQQIASGFNRNHGTTDEGGAIDEEYRVEYVVDRVKTTSTIWLGLTMECGQCHDHKYDPISQKEYYQFYAYFNQTKDVGMQTRNGNAAPFVYLFTPEQEERIAALNEEISRLETLHKEKLPEADVVSAWASLQREKPEPDPPVLGSWVQLGPFQADNVKQAFNKDFGPEKPEALSLEKTYAGTQWKLQEQYKDGAVVPLDLPDNSAAYLFRTLTVPHPESFLVSLGSDDGIKVWLNGKELLSNNAARGAAADQEKVTLNLQEGENQFLMKINNGGGASGFYFKITDSGIPGDIRKLIQIADSELRDEQRKKIVGFYAKTLWKEGLDRAEKINKLKAEENAIREGVPTSMTMQEMESPRPTYVLNRGHYASPIKDEIIKPGTPSALPPLPENARHDRLGLAQWLVNPNHPLTARVTVNRYWQMLFGQGIVATVSDFGTRGAWPSHPDLLDWLARDFVDNGWNIKRTIKQMVLSSTYRQSSNITPEKMRKDPQNILLSHAPRLRLQGEFIRDNALMLSGLLQEKIGGPSVKPYQPPGIWNEVSLDGNLRYKRDDGENLYRRSMYIYWKRSAPSPSMVTFDAPTREKCVIQRQRTNTPLQALVTLNDVQFVESSRLFAHRIMREGGDAFADRLNYAFLLATSRPADSIRHDSLNRFYQNQRAVFQHQPDRAKALLEFGEHPNDPSLDPAELAAWTMVASAILNLDEVLTKE